MKIIKYFKNILCNLYLSLKRFPFTILLSASVAAVLIAISELNSREDTLIKTAMVLALGIPLSLSIKLFFEKREEDNTYKLTIGYFMGALLLILYYVFLLPNDMGMVSVTRYIAVTLALYLTFLFIPYFPKKPNFEIYVITIVTGFFITIIYSLVLYGGLSAILFSVDKLLGVKILGKVYYYTFLFVVFIFAVCYFLSGIPLKNEALSSKSYPKLLRVLILYIVMPLLTAYTLILYLYFGKIIITMQWPIGLVSHLVLWYSVIVTIVLFSITPILDENGWAYRFLKVAPKILLPLLIMMFISMGIRINAYGFTEPRYYVVILGLWVFCIMLYFSFTKKLKNILIPVTLAFVAIFAVFGPLSSYSVSIYSQSHRFEKILLENNMLEGSNIKSSDTISKEDKAHISSILEYFNRNHNLKDLKYLPDNFKIQDMKNTFGFEYQYAPYESMDQYFYFTRSPQEKAVDIKGYDYLFDMMSLMNKAASPDKDLDVSYNYEKATIKISYRGKEIYTEDFNVFLKDLINKNSNALKESNLPEEEMMILRENDKIKVKIIFRSISGSINKANDSIENKGIDFYLLVQIK